jgi:hypothetical protein
MHLPLLNAPTLTALQPKQSLLLLQMTMTIILTSSTSIEESAVPAVSKKDGFPCPGCNDDGGGSGGSIAIDGEGGGSTLCCRGIKQFFLYNFSCKDKQAFCFNQFG